MRQAHNLPARCRPVRSSDRPDIRVVPVTRGVTTKAMILLLPRTRSARGIRDTFSASNAPRNAIAAQPNVRESSSGIWNAGTGLEQDGFRIGTIARTGIAHLALTSSRPGHTRVSSHSPVRERKKRPTASWQCRLPYTPLVGASALHGVSGRPRSHLGSTLGSGKSCPDPGRLSTFGVSGLYPCRRLTYRGESQSPCSHQNPCSSNLLRDKFDTRV